MTEQWGDPMQNVTDRGAFGFTWSCVWGCHDWGFENESDAEEAFLAHKCEGKKS